MAKVGVETEYSKLLSDLSQIDIQIQSFNIE